MGSMPLPTLAFQLASYLAALWFSLSVHEFAHGWVAKKRGDRTAEMMGRVTLNPMAHLDMIGTVFLPILAFFNPTGFHLFGWAKPVPVDSRYLKNPRVDLFWIAFAGPISNVLLALGGTLGLAVFLVWKSAVLLPCLVGQPGCDQGMLDLMRLIQMFIMLNISLFLLNMIPVHPLDGGKVIARFLPRAWAQRLEELEGPLAMGLMLVAIVGGLSLLLAGPVRWISGGLFGAAQSLASMFGAFGG